MSLEAYVGKTVKIAFYFRSILVNNYTQATLAVDNVKVGNQEIENLPVVEGSTSYEFSNSYIGYLAQSEPMTIRNVGYGTLTITSIEGIEGTDFSTTLDPASVSLKRGEELSYRVNYTPTIMGAKSTVMKINTNGGTLSVDLSGTKVMLEDCIKDLTEVESVSLEGLASGMYIVSVSCGDSVSTARVMKR